MAAEVVHDDDVARAERRHQELFDIGEEGLAVDRTVDHAGRIDPVTAQRGKEGEGSPFSMGHLRAKSLPAPAAAMGAGHVGLGPGFIDENQTGGIETPLIFTPLRSSPGDPWPILFAGEQAFF